MSRISFSQPVGSGFQLSPGNQPRATIWKHLRLGRSTTCASRATSWYGHLDPRRRNHRRISVPDLLFFGEFSDMTIPWSRGRHVTDHRESQFILKGQEWFDDLDGLLSKRVSHPLSSLCPSLRLINDPRPRLVLLLSSLLTRRLWSQLPLRRVPVCSPWPLARIVCSAKYGIETKRDAPPADQDARGSSKGSGSQYHTLRCLARRDHRLLSGTWPTNHRY